MTSSHHGPYDQGYTRATMAHTKRSELARASGPHKVRRSPDWSLQLDSMQSESLVIVDQNATVNTFSGLVPVSYTHLCSHDLSVADQGTVYAGRRWRRYRLCSMLRLAEHSR